MTPLLLLALLAVLAPVAIVLALLVLTIRAEVSRPKHPAPERNSR